MNTLTSQLQSYIGVRRSFGYDLATTERVLRQFTAFAESNGTEYVTVELFLQWKSHFGAANNNTWSARLGMVRGFATWLEAVDARTQVPPAGLVVGRRRRMRPYIYTEEQLQAIIEEATHCRSPYGIRGAMWSTFYGLISVTGMRVNEAIGLDDADVDLYRGAIMVRCSKNGGARVVPITHCTVDRLGKYVAERERLLGQSPAQFFQQENGMRPTDCGARYNFSHVCQRLGLRAPQIRSRHGRGPRIHDIRHTVAVRTIIGWFRSGLDVDREMPKLSTFLGHTKPEHTYWYIEAVPELLQLASKRASRVRVGGLS